MTENIIKDEKGVVLILVLIVLVAAIIIGVTVIKSSVLEARIAGNEQRFVVSLNNLETGIDLFTLQCTSGIIALGNTVTVPATVYTYTNPSLPSSTHVTATLLKVGKPPVGSINGMEFRARYYEIQAKDDETHQTVTVRAYKIFPQDAPD